MDRCNSRSTRRFGRLQGRRVERPKPCLDRTPRRRCPRSPRESPSISFTRRSSSKPRTTVGIGPAPAFLLLSFSPPASTAHLSTTHRNHSHTPARAALWHLLSSTPLWRASLAERHRCTIPRCNRRTLRVLGATRMVPRLTVRNMSPALRP